MIAPAALLVIAGAQLSLKVPEIALVDRTIRAGDIASVAGYDQVVVGELPADRDSVVIDAETAQRLLRNRLPYARFALRFHSQAVLVSGGEEQRASGRCFAAKVEITAGSIVHARDLEETACKGRIISPALSYDRGLGAPTARDTILPGDFLGSIRGASADVAPQGKRMVLRSRAGPVVIERPVETLQPAHPGEKVFVKTNDGVVLSVRLAASTEENR